MDRAINVQTCQVHSASQQSESRVVHRFKGFRKTPAFDAYLSQSGAVFEPDVSAESVYGAFGISIPCQAEYHHNAVSVSGAKTYLCSGNVVCEQQGGTAE